MVLRAASVALAAALAGCLPVDKPGVDGQLGSTAFFYVCSEASDPACDDQPAMTPFEKLPLVAVGATFDIRLDATDETASSPTSFLDEVSAGPGYSRFRAKKPGYAVILSQGATSNATDFTHIKIAAPAGLAAEHDGDGLGKYQKLDPTAGLTRAVGKEQLRAFSITADGTELAGSLPTQWKTSDAKIVALDTDPTDDQITIEALAPGKATLSVVVDQKQISFDVTVTGGVP
jgi:hypothetical protein